MNVSFTIFSNILNGDLLPDASHNQDHFIFSSILANKLRSNSDCFYSYFKVFNDSISPFYPNLSSCVFLFDNTSKDCHLPDYFHSLSFQPFFDKKSEFYFYLIKNETDRIYSYSCKIVSAAESPEIKSYESYKILSQILLLFDLSASVSWGSTDALYVIYNLRIALLRLYYMCQIRFSEYTAEHFITDTEVLAKIDPQGFFNDNNPSPIVKVFKAFLNAKSNSDLKSAPTALVDSFPLKSVAKSLPFTFRNSDFRPGFKGKVSFNDIINPDKFANFEKNLFEYEYIDTDYNFTNKHGKKKEIAALFKIIIEKKFFRDNLYKSRSKLRPAHIRQYLDFRYNTKTDQEFRKCTIEFINQLKNNHYWVDQL